MDNSSQNSLLMILRWILFIPLAIGSSFIGWYLVNIFGRFGLFFVQVEPDSFVAQFYFNFAGNAAMAIAFVYIGSKVAPFYRKTVAYILSGIWLLFSGFAIFSSIMVKSGWGIFGGICGFIIIPFFILSIYKNEIEI